MEIAGHTVQQIAKELEELRRSEEQYRQLLDQMNDGHCITRDQKILFANIRLAEMLGCTVEELTGRMWPEFLQPDTADYIERMPLADLPWPMEVQVTRVDGQKIPVELNVFPTTFQGRIAEFAIIRDLTESKRMEALIEAQRELSVALGATADLQHALELCLETALSVSEMDKGGIYLTNPKTGRLDLIYPPSAPASRDDALFLEEPHAQQVMQGRPVYIQPAVSNGRAAALIPIPDQQKIIGCMHIVSHGAGEIPLVTRHALETIASQIGSAIARIRAEDALRESQARKFQGIVEHSLDGIVLIDETGKVVEWNPGQEHITGLPKTEVLGQPIWEVQFRLLPPEQQLPERKAQYETRIRAFLNAGRSTAEAPIWEQEIQRPDGTRRVIQQAAFPVKTETGFMAGGITRDVTQDRRAQQALQESEERYRFLIENQGEGICIFDTQERFIFSNRVADEIFGVVPDELEGKNLRDFVSPETFAAIQRQTQRRRAGNRDTYEVEIIRPDGEKRQLLVTATPWLDKNGNFLGSFSIFRDETQRHQAEQRIRLLSMAVEQSTEGIAVTDLEGNLLFVNHAFAAMHGFTPQELHGQHLSIFHTAEQMPAVEAANHQIRTSGEFNGEIWHVRRDGSTFPGLMHNSLLHDEAGNPIGMIGTLRDITDRKQTEEKLRRRNLELALLNRSAQALIATLDTDRILRIVLDEMRHLLGAVPCSAWLIDPKTDELICQQAVGPDSDILQGWHLPKGTGIVGWVVQQAQSAIVPDARQDPRHYTGVDERVGLETRALISVPLVTTSGVLGVLQAIASEPGCFKQVDLTVPEPLAATAAMALQNARLFEQIRQDAETRAVLLREVNHRVKNNLSIIIGLLYAARRYTEAKDQPIYRSIMNDLINRVQSLATVHGMLSASRWTPLPLSELCAQIVRTALQALPSDKHVALDVTQSSVRVTPAQASSLALVINELATNTVKYVLQKGRNTARMAIRITQHDRTICLEFCDDGPGYPQPVLGLKRYSAGFELIQNIVRKNLHGKLKLYNKGGAVARIQFPTRPQNER